MQKDYRPAGNYTTHTGIFYVFFFGEESQQLGEFWSDFRSKSCHQRAAGAISKSMFFGFSEGNAADLNSILKLKRSTTTPNASRKKSGRIDFLSLSAWWNWGRDNFVFAVRGTTTTTTTILHVHKKFLHTHTKTVALSRSLNHHRILSGWIFFFLQYMIKCLPLSLPPPPSPADKY